MAASDCIDSTEVLVWRKASSLPDFPPQKVSQEMVVDVFKLYIHNLQLFVTVLQSN